MENLYVFFITFGLAEFSLWGVVAKVPMGGKSRKIPPRTDGGAFDEGSLSGKGWAYGDKNFRGFRTPGNGDFASTRSTGGVPNQSSRVLRDNGTP